MEGQDGIAGIVGIVKEGRSSASWEVLLEPGDRGGEVGLDALTLGRELGQDLELLLLAEDLAEELDVLLEELLLLLEGLRGLLVLPDLGRGQADVYRRPFGVLAIMVKENLGPLRLSRRGRRGVS